MQHSPINNLQVNSASLDGVSPVQVCISRGEKMRSAKDEVGILIYEWTVSEFSGNAFSHPSRFTETHIDWRRCTPPPIVLPSIRQIESPSGN